MTRPGLHTRPARWMPFGLASTLFVLVAAQPSAVLAQAARPEASPAVAAGVDATTVDEDAPQRRPAQRPPVVRPIGPRGPAFRLQGFGELDFRSFTASQTFAATLGSSRGIFWGGGARLRHRSGLFGQIDVTRFTDSGTRVFVFNGQPFPLNVALDVTEVPIEFSGGYEFTLRRRPRAPRPGQSPRPVSTAPTRPRVVPYVAGGVGIVRYTETSAFAAGDEDVSESFTSFHVLGGVQVPVWRMIGTAFDLHYRRVPDSLGTGGASQAFGETDLGGVGVRVRFTIGG